MGTYIAWMPSSLNPIAGQFKDETDAAVLWALGMPALAFFREALRCMLLILCLLEGASQFYCSICGVISVDGAGGL
jgi:hypothetical protein